MSLNLCECGFRVARNLLFHFCLLAQGHRERHFLANRPPVGEKMRQITAFLGPALRISGGVTKRIRE
ncbi:MAG: hypothetical protein ACREDA_13360, partial [Methylocella sp.]